MSLPILLSAALTGDGTYASPWSGTLEGDATWSGTKYINGDIIIDNEKLTISAGAIIIFLSETADLVITGTGQIEAAGTFGSIIRFTSDDDNDGTYGEAGERWGHISFQSMGSAGSSLFDYCIIEYGDVTSFSNTDPHGAGGGLHLNFTNVAITNCTFQHNKSQWGGGIFVYSDRSPSISNCYFYDNFAKEAGGGIYLWDRSGSVVQNCIFYSNSCQGYSSSNYTGGGLAAQSSTSVKIVNCTFANNTSSRTEGKGIMIYSSVNARVINSIFWGSTKEVYCAGTSASNIVNCAYQGITYSTGTPVNSIVLNASNTNPAGPNFKATDGSDWSVQYVSPCRDAGVNSYTGVTIPALDYAGNSRVLTTDIGAYEVQYSRWKTTASSTDWNTASNWDGGVPSSSREVVVPTGATNYPIGSTTQDFTIGTGRLMIIEQGSIVTLDDLTNNGIIKLYHNASGFASLIINSYTRGTGATEEIQLYLTGGGSELLEDYKWHYISTPVSSLSTGIFTGVTLDLAQFVESRPSTSLLQGWVAFDGYIYSTGQSTGPTFSTLTPGKGYNFWDGVNNTFTFGGLFNTSDVVMSLGFSGLPTMHGFNLLGNPFSSGLNWDDIADGVYFTYPANTSKGVYFTRNNLQCTYINGVGTPGDVTGIIPPMQGFFTKTYATGNSITLAAAARTHSSLHARYKGSGVIPLVRLAMNEDTVTYDETVVRFDDLAKTDLDNDFDAVKMFLSSTKTTIHTSMGGTDYAINGLPFPAPDATTEIPVVVNVTTTGIHKISASQLQGLDSYGVVLKDNITGFTADLKTTPEIIFTAPSGLLSDRFVLKVGNIATGLESPESAPGVFSIYHGYDFINILPLADEWNGITGSIKVLDITGKSVTDLQNTEFSRNSIIQLPAPGAKGLYVVQIRSGVKRYVGKVVVK